MDQSTERLLKTSQKSSDAGSSLYDQSSVSSSPELDVFYTELVSANLPTPPKPSNFTLGAYRTRHLSCILENWSESESYNSLPIEATSPGRPDESFAEALDAASTKPHCWEAEDVDEYITTLDETCIRDIESFEHIDQLMPPPKTWPRKRRAIQVEMHPEPIECQTGAPIEQYPTIMTASCYGALDTSFESTTCLVDPEMDVLDQLTQMLKNTEIEPLENYLYLNPPLLNNQPKCRSPLPMSLNSSFCEGSVSLNNSFYEPRSMQTSIDFGACSGNGLLVTGCSGGAKTTINSLDVSFASQDEMGGEMLEEMVDNGKLYFQQYFMKIYFVYIMDHPNSPGSDCIGYMRNSHAPCVQSPD